MVCTKDIVCVLLCLVPRPWYSLRAFMFGTASLVQCVCAFMFGTERLVQPGCFYVSYWVLGTACVCFYVSYRELGTVCVCFYVWYREIGTVCVCFYVWYRELAAINANLSSSQAKPSPPLWSTVKSFPWSNFKRFSARKDHFLKQSQTHAFS